MMKKVGESIFGFFLGGEDDVKIVLAQEEIDGTSFKIIEKFKIFSNCESQREKERS